MKKLRLKHVKKMEFDLMDLYKNHLIELKNKNNIMKRCTVYVDIYYYLNSNKNNIKEFVLWFYGDIYIVDKNNELIVLECGDIVKHLECFKGQNIFIDRIIHVWKYFNNKDKIKPGTPKQIKCLCDFMEKNNMDYEPSYRECINILDKYNLVYDNNFYFGEDFIIPFIPNSIIEEVFSWDEKFYNISL